MVFIKCKARENSHKFLFYPPRAKISVKIHYFLINKNFTVNLKSLLFINKKINFFLFINSQLLKRT